MDSKHLEVPDENVKAMQSLSLQKTVSDDAPPSYGESMSQERVATRTASTEGLQKPIAIPATDAKLGSPFLRAYPPSIEGFGMPKETFMHFLDDLNRVAVKNPPLQVLGLASNFVGFVPLQSAQIAGAAMGAVSAVGTYVVSKGRTELYLRKANKDIFKPRGLKVEIGKAEALAKIADMPQLDASGKLDKDTPLLNPVEKWELKPTVSGQDRRLRAFEPWIAKLELDNLPQIDTPSNPLSKWSAAASEQQRKKGEKKLMKSRQKAYKKGPEGVDRKHERRMQKLEARAAEAEEMGDMKRLAKAERKMAKREDKYDERMSKAEQKVTKNKEEKSTRKILWLIIRNLDADSGEGPDPYTEGSTDISDLSSSSASSSSSSLSEEGDVPQVKQ